MVSAVVLLLFLLVALAALSLPCSLVHEHAIHVISIIIIVLLIILGSGMILAVVLLLLSLLLRQGSAAFSIRTGIMLTTLMLILIWLFKVLQFP